MISRNHFKWPKPTPLDKKMLGGLAAAVGVLSAVTGLVGIYVHNVTEVLVGSVILIIAASSLCIVTSRVIKRKVLLPVPVMVGALAIAALLGAAFGDVIGYRIRTPARSQPHASSVPVSKSGINFLRPQDGDLEKECLVVEGSGTMPANTELYIFTASRAEPGRYWPVSLAKMNSTDHWSAIGPVVIGSSDNNGQWKIYGVVIEKKWADYLSAASGGDYWSSLPPNEAVIGPVIVTRIPDPGGQSCNSIPPR